MGDFITFARRMIKDRLMLGLAICFAVIAGLGTGVGLLSIVPIIKMIIDEKEGYDLPQLAERFNEGEREVLGMTIDWDIPQWIIDTVPAGRFEGVIFIIGFIAVITVFSALATFTHQYLSITVVARTIAHARLAAFRTALMMPLVTVTHRGASEFVARIIRDSAEIQRGLVAMTSKAIAHATQGIAAFIVAIVVGQRLTIAALILVPLLAVIIKKLGTTIRRGTRGAMQGQEDLLRVATETVQGLRSVKVNTGEQQSLTIFDRMNWKVVREEMRARIARAISGPLVETLAILVVGGLAILAVKMILDDQLTVSRFTVAIGSLGLAGSKFKMVAKVITELQAASAPARRILDVLQEPYEDGTSEFDRTPVAERVDLPPHEESIRFEKVTFTYPKKRERALDDVTVEVRHGERVAVVGPNGSGKTTLLSMIPRLLAPDTGSVLIDDHDLADVTLTSLRRQVAVVTQETMLFRGTVAENIAFGTDDVKREQIISAAKRAHAHDFIEQIPGGYDADIAEQGASLSGGQRQRIAIARAILRNPSILILDEATSQIDAESEAEINAALAEFCEGRTVLVIAHRLATVRDADRIIVMDRGKVVDTGPHTDLLDRCAVYQRLSQTQLIGV